MLINQEYYWLNLTKSIKVYVKSRNIYLILKIIKQKFYNNLQLMLILTHYWKNFSIDIVIKFSFSTN